MRLLVLFCAMFALQAVAHNTAESACVPQVGSEQVCVCHGDMIPAPAAEIAMATEEREAGKCSCGGSLKFSAKAFATTETCTLCKGNKVYGGEVCTLCHGSGSIVNYSSGYICEKCGNKYDKWEP